MQFQDLKLQPALVAAVSRLGYSKPTPIQAQAIPHALLGRDLLACAQTGTGKTAAFALPVLHRLLSQPSAGLVPRALVLVPTRELAGQVAACFADYTPKGALRTVTVVGGMSLSAQARALRVGSDVVVATPGRLLDLLAQRLISLREIEVLVLDEADRMLDMGFITPIRQIAAQLPRERQTMLLSATMPASIRTLASQLLRDPAQVAVAPVASTAERIDQEVYFIERENKLGLLMHVLATPAADRVIVFTRTKHGANRLAEKLRRARVGAEVIHGNRSQGQRQRALDNFKEGRARVLVATDVAARGIDVDGVSHVVNFDVPNEPESYVHRIGRTGRAGAAGIAISFCDRDERGHLRDIERLIKRPLRVVRAPRFEDRHSA